MYYDMKVKKNKNGYFFVNRLTISHKFHIQFISMMIFYAIYNLQLLV